MKKEIILAIIVLLLVVIVFVSLYLYNTLKGYKDEMNNLVITNVNLETIPDGRYLGDYETTFIKVIVEVSVKNHEITDVDLIKHENGSDEKAETIINDVIEKQSLNVDTISGATFSSKAILKAIENALENKEE